MMIINPFTSDWTKTSHSQELVESEHQGRNGGYFISNGNQRFFIKNASLSSPYFEKAVGDIALYLGARVAPSHIAQGIDETGTQWTGLASEVLADRPMHFEEYIESSLPDSVIYEDFLQSGLVEEYTRLHDPLAFFEEDFGSSHESIRAFMSKHQERKATQDFLAKTGNNIVAITLLGLTDVNFRKHLIVDQANPDNWYQIDLGHSGPLKGLGEYKRFNPYTSESEVVDLCHALLESKSLEVITHILYDARVSAIKNFKEFASEANFHSYRMQEFDNFIAKVIINYGELTRTDVTAELDAHQSKLQICKEEKIILPETDNLITAKPAFKDASNNITSRNSIISTLARGVQSVVKAFDFA